MIGDRAWDLPNGARFVPNLQCKTLTLDGWNGARGVPNILVLLVSVTYCVTLTSFLTPVYRFSEGSLYNDLTDLSQVSTPPIIGFSLPF